MFPQFIGAVKIYINHINCDWFKITPDGLDKIVATGIISVKQSN